MFNPLGMLSAMEHLTGTSTVQCTLAKQCFIQLLKYNCLTAKSSIGHTEQFQLQHEEILPRPVFTRYTQGVNICYKDN